jgi:hypothetical protein
MAGYVVPVFGAAYQAILAWSFKVEIVDLVSSAVDQAILAWSF